MKYEIISFIIWYYKYAHPFLTTFDFFFFWWGGFFCTRSDIGLQWLFILRSLIYPPTFFLKYIFFIYNLFLHGNNMIDKGFDLIKWISEGKKKKKTTRSE